MAVPPRRQSVLQPPAVKIHNSSGFAILVAVIIITSVAGSINVDEPDGSVSGVEVNGTNAAKHCRMRFNRTMRRHEPNATRQNKMQMHSLA